MAAEDTAVGNGGPIIRTIPGTNGAVDLAETRRKLLRDRGPSSRKVSDTRAQYHASSSRDLGGDPFDSNKVTWKALYQMRNDPMISFGLHYIIMPNLTANWKIRCEDARVAAAVDNALRPIIGRLILQDANKFSFGCSPMVKRFEEMRPTWKYEDPLADPTEKTKYVWDQGDLSMLVWKHFVALKPDKTWPSFKKASGDFDGMLFEGDPSGFAFTDIPSSNRKKIPLDVSLWSVNQQDREFGSVWGYPQIAFAQKYWWTYWWLWALCNRHYEDDVDPPAVIYYPEDVIVDELAGETKSYKDEALNTLADARSGSDIALPNSVIRDELDGRPTTIREWAIDFLRNETNFSAFEDRFRYLDVMKLRALWVPEQAFMEGQGGSSSRNVAEQMGDMFQAAASNRISEFDHMINRYMIPQFVAHNFPDKADISCEKVTSGVTPKDKSMIQEIVRLMLQPGEDRYGVDVREILRENGVPLKTPEELKAEQERLAEEAAAAAPPPGEGIPGVEAAIAEVPTDPSQVQDATVGALPVAGFERRYVQLAAPIDLTGEGDVGLQRSDGITLTLCDQMPEHLFGASAAFDPADSTAYVLHSVPVDERDKFMSAIAAQQGVVS